MFLFKQEMQSKLIKDPLIILPLIWKKVFMVSYLFLRFSITKCLFWGSLHGKIFVIPIDI